MTDYPLSSSEIQKLYFSNVFIYNDLHKYDNINKLFKNWGCYILFETKPKFGHWTCLVKLGETIEFFDPMGIDIEEQKKYIPHDILDRNNYISILLKKSRYHVSYNHIKFQKKGTNTCGRWCATRLFFHKLSLQEFSNFVNKSRGSMSPDDWVIKITSAGL